MRQPENVFFVFRLPAYCLPPVFEKDNPMKPLLICMALLCCKTVAAETLFSCQAGKDRYELNRNDSRLVLSRNGQKLSDTAAASAIQSHTPATISLLVQNHDRADNMYQITDFKSPSAALPTTIVHSYLAGRHDRKTQTAACSRISRSLYRADLSAIPREDFSESWDFYKDFDEGGPK